MNNYNIFDYIKMNQFKYYSKCCVKLNRFQYRNKFSLRSFNQKPSKKRTQFTTKHKSNE